MESENVSRLNAVRRASLVSIEKSRAYNEDVTTPMVCAIACVCACSAQMMTPGVPGLGDQPDGNKPDEQGPGQDGLVGLAGLALHQARGGSSVAQPYRLEQQGGEVHPQRVSSMSAPCLTYATGGGT